MTQDDKVFFTGLARDLKSEFKTELKAELETFRSEFKAEIRKDFKDIKDEMNYRFDVVDKRLEDHDLEFRKLGLELELLHEDVYHINERDTSLVEMNAKLDATLEVMGIDVPALKRSASNHGRVLASHGKRIRYLEGRLV